VVPASIRGLQSVAWGIVCAQARLILVAFYDKIAGNFKLPFSF